MTKQKKLPGCEDIAIRLRSTRANMIGTDDEQHYWDCQDAADEIVRLRKEIDRLRESGLCHATPLREIADCLKGECN